MVCFIAQLALVDTFCLDPVCRATSSRQLNNPKNRISSQKWRHFEDPKTPLRKTGSFTLTCRRVQPGILRVQQQLLQHMLGGGFEYFYVHPDPRGNEPIWRTYFSSTGWFNHQLAMVISNIFFTINIVTPNTLSCFFPRTSRHRCFVACVWGPAFRRVCM